MKAYKQSYAAVMKFTEHKIRMAQKEKCKQEKKKRIYASDYLGRDLHELVMDYLVGTRNFWKKELYDYCLLLFEGKTACLECRKQYLTDVFLKPFGVMCRSYLSKEGYAYSQATIVRTPDWSRHKLAQPGKMHINHPLSYCNSCITTFIQAGILELLPTPHFRCTRCRKYLASHEWSHGGQPTNICCVYCITEEESDHFASMQPFSVF